MGLLSRWRRHRLPADAYREFEPGEHVVAWAPHERGYLVATTRGLWLPDFAERLGWHEIHKATWTGQELTILPSRQVSEAGSGPDAPADVVADAEPALFRLSDPGELPHEVRVRVTRSVVYSQHHELPNGGVRVLGRRVPGRDGVSFQLRYDPGTALAGADHELVTELVTQARESLEG